MVRPAGLTRAIVVGHTVGCQANHHEECFRERGGEGGEGRKRGKEGGERGVEQGGGGEKGEREGRNEERRREKGGGKGGRRGGKEEIKQVFIHTGTRNSISYT